MDPPVSAGKVRGPQYVCEGVANSTLGACLLIQALALSWSVILHRLPGQCHSLLTAPEADSGGPRGRVLSRWQTPPESVSLRGAGSLAIMDPGIRQMPLEVILDNAHSNETPLAPG